MQSIADQMMSRYQVKKTKGGIQGPWHDAIDRLMGVVKDTNWPFARWGAWLNRKGLGVDNVQKLNEFISIAEKSDNPGRTFFGQVKRYQSVDN